MLDGTIQAECLRFGTEQLLCAAILPQGINDRLGHLAESQRAVCLFERLKLLMEAIEQIPGRPRLLGKLPQNLRLGVLKECLVQGLGIRRNRFLAIGRFAGKDLCSQAAADELLPILTLEVGNVLHLRTQESFVAANGKIECAKPLEGCGPLGCGHRRRNRKAFPGKTIRAAINFIMRIDDFLKSHLNGPCRLAFAQKWQQPANVVRIFFKQLLQCLKAQGFVVSLFADRPARGQPQFKAEAASQCQVETIEGADAQAMKLAQHAPKKCSKTLPGAGRNLNLCGKARASFVLPAALANRSSTRSSISAAALRVKVVARIASGSTPAATKPR